MTRDASPTAGSDLFPGFAARRIKTADAELFVRIGGVGPPLLLLNGYPQTHACWHRVVPRLAAHFTTIACDFPGYGASRVLGESRAYSKRAMASALAEMMDGLGLEQFSVVGHDRGARAAYRLALDHPRRVERLVVLSIFPTFAMWRRLRDPAYAMKAFHWYFLAQPAPFPERLTGPTAIPYLRALLASWTADNDLAAFSPDALAAYETAFTPEVIAAACEDYRAGWRFDRLDDERDIASGRRIRCPALALWGGKEFPDATEMLSAWREICADVGGRALDCGHFLLEEASDAAAEHMLGFLVQRN